MRGGANLNSSISILGKLGGEELVELSIEASISDELALCRHLGSLGHHLEKLHREEKWKMGKCEKALIN
jgi:hypothetical protein